MWNLTYQINLDMSNIYNLEPVTKGKVLLTTTHGDIEIELWAREVCSINQGPIIDYPLYNVYF